MKIKSIVIMLLFFINNKTSNAQTDTCLSKVKNIYKVWSNVINENKGNTIYLKYETDITVENKDKLENNKTLVELIFNQENSMLLTNNLMVFEDKKHTVSVKNDKKLIIINGFVGDRYKQEKLKHFEFLQDSMFQQLKTMECKNMIVDNQPYKRVVLKATPYGMKSFNVKTMSFLLDEKHQMVKKMEVNYTKDYHLYAIKVNILHQDLNYQTNLVKKTALENVFDKNGKLHSKYVGYKIIDNRK